MWSILSLPYLAKSVLIKFLIVSKNGVDIAFLDICICKISNKDKFWFFKDSSKKEKTPEEKKKRLQEMFDNCKPHLGKSDIYKIEMLLSFDLIKEITISGSSNGLLISVIPKIIESELEHE